MDLKSKGITWVENIYQKFESLCLEVDSLMSQDKVKYVESQVHSSCEHAQKLCAGDMMRFSEVHSSCENDEKLHAEAMQDKARYVESQVHASCENVQKSCAGAMQGFNQAHSSCDDVQKLCAEAMQDKVKYAECQVHPSCENVMQGFTLSPFTCSVGNDSIHDVDMGMGKTSPTIFGECLVNGKPLSPPQLEATISVEQDLSTVSLLDEPQDINHVEACNTLTKESIPFSIKVAGSNVGSAVESNDVSDAVPCISINESIEENNDVSDVVSSISSHESIEENNDVSDAVPCISNQLSIPLSETVLPPASYENVAENGLMPHDCASSTDVTDTCNSLQRISLVEYAGNEHERDSEPAEIKAFVWPLEIGEFEDVKLNDDDCADSKEEMDEIYLIAALKARKERSYKKKLQDVLFSRIRPTKQHDYERMEVWFRDFNLKTKQREDSKEVQPQNGIESDWELL